eukprot:353335-Chlamydomonas_euryale.AAC.3
MMHAARLGRSWQQSRGPHTCLGSNIDSTHVQGVAHVLSAPKPDTCPPPPRTVLHTPTVAPCM